MPTVRKPTEILKLNASLDHNTDRKRARAKEPLNRSPLGTPPKHLPNVQKAIWHEVIMINPPGVLTSSDRMVVELLCILMGKAA